MKLLFSTLIFFLVISNVSAQQKQATPPAQNDPEIVDHSPFEHFPSFPGGVKAYYNFLQENLKMCEDGEAQGKVYVSFIVEKDGHLTKFKFEKSLTEDCDLEAIRVLKKSPKWIPGIQNGKRVRVKYTVPISFIIAD